MKPWKRGLKFEPNAGDLHFVLQQKILIQYGQINKETIKKVKLTQNQIRIYAMLSSVLVQQYLEKLCGNFKSSPK